MKERDIYIQSGEGARKRPNSLAKSIELNSDQGPLAFFGLRFAKNCRDTRCMLRQP